jgi:hypothetical protein
VSLAKNTHVTTLYLQGCRIDDIGASLLAFALRKNTTIQQLWLNRNKIGDVGADAIAFALSENRKLKILGLNYNSIGNYGGKAISNAFKHNRVVTDVFLRGNEISEGTLSKIYCYCERNHHEKLVRKSSASSKSNTKSSKRGSVLPSIQEHIPGMRRAAPKRNSIAAKCA